VIAMEIEDSPTIFQEDQVPKVAILDAPLTMEAKHEKEDSEYANRDVDYGNEGLPLFGKEIALPCLQTNIIAHFFKQIVVEYSYSEDGMSDIQVMEIKRPRCSTRVPAHKNPRRDQATKKKILLES